MNRHIFPGAVGLVRAWVWLYTLPLDPLERDRRRREIASDLWEFEADRRSVGASFTAAVHIVARGLLGVPDDLLWTCERLAADRHVLRPSALVRAAIAVIGMATVVVAASGPALDLARALKVHVESAGWVNDADNPRSAFAPAIAFTLANIGDQGTAALDVNAVFHRADEGGGALGLGTAFAPVVGWRGLDARTTSRRVLLHGQPSYVIDARTSRAVAVPLDDLDEVHVQLFVHHEGRWTALGDFRVPAQRMSR